MFTDRLGPLSHKPVAGNGGSVIEERRKDRDSKVLVITTLIR